LSFDDGIAHLGLRGLRVADARQQVGNGIGHAHDACAPYQLALRGPGTSPRIVASRSLLRRQAELAVHAARAARHRAAIAHAAGARVARQLLQLDLRFGASPRDAFGLRMIFLQLRALGGVALRDLRARFSRFTMMVLAMGSVLPLLAEREAEGFEQRPARTWSSPWW
jgi:hypothetical protein